jgi:hypothetical protein
MTHPTPISSISVTDDREEAVVRPDWLERRSRARFPFDLRVRYRTLGRTEPFSGVGRLVNMSSGGVLVAYQDRVRTGARMELNIEWPSLLDGEVPLQLVAMGKVVRCEASSFAMALGRYQFRTTRRAVIPINGPWTPSRAASA